MSVVRVNRVDWINVLRVLAWLFVFQTHTILSVTEFGWTHTLVFKGHDLTWLLLPPAWAGVWLFFGLSGYLVGKGYFAGRYASGIKGSLRFYWNRFIRIAPPYYFAVAVIYLVTGGPAVAPENLRFLIPVLTFTYRGDLPFNPAGWLWFVSTLMALYLVTPLFWAAIQRWSKRRGFVLTALVVVVIAGMALRVTPMFLWPGADVGKYWYPVLYTPPWMNLDIFFGAFLAAGLIGQRKPSLVRSRVDRVVALGAFTAFWLASSWLAMWGTQWGSLDAFRVFVFGFPTVALLVMILWLYALDTGARRTSINWVAVRQNPLRAIEMLAPLTYGMFIWHSLFLTLVAPRYLGRGPLSTYALRAGVTLALTIAVAAVIQVAIERPLARLKRVPAPVLEAGAADPFVDQRGDA